MVDELVIQRIIGDIKANINELRRAGDIDWETYRSDIRLRRFVERTLQIIIEAMLDIAHHIISDEGLREPESYREAFRILAENGFLSRERLELYERMAGFRNLLVHYYEKIDDAIVYGIFRKRLGDFEAFIEDIMHSCGMGESKWLKREALRQESRGSQR